MSKSHQTNNDLSETSTFEPIRNRHLLNNIIKYFLICIIVVHLIQFMILFASNFHSYPIHFILVHIPSVHNFTNCPYILSPWINSQHAKVRIYLNVTHSSLKQTLSIKDTIFDSVRTNLYAMRQIRGNDVIWSLRERLNQCALMIYTKADIETPIFWMMNKPTIYSSFILNVNNWFV